MLVVELKPKIQVLIGDKLIFCVKIGARVQDLHSGLSVLGLSNQKLVLRFLAPKLR